MDGLALTGLAAAAAASAGAALLARSGNVRAALASLVLAAVCLRVPPAAHLGLSPWDERYHALVAKNALAHPLQPMLIADPLGEPAPSDWLHAHVWLHKPPLTTWLIALSYAAFGVNELALRVPSLVLSSALVLVVFALARRFASERAALFAAALAAWHARSLLLVAGVRATDHVDVAMVFAVGLGALAALRAAESLGESGFWRRVVVTGVATAGAYYVKETPALVVPAVLFAALAARGASWRVRCAAPALALGVALALVLPWQLYVAHAWPELAAYARARGSRYFLTVVDSQGGPWTYHLVNLPFDFGWLAPLAVAWLAVESLRGRRALAPFAVWLALVYGAFTLAATKMQSYVLIAAPALFAAVAWLAQDAVPRRFRRWLLLAAAANAVFSVVSAEAPGEAKARDPLWARELRRLGEEVETLPPGKRLVFGVASPIECMFYVRATCARGQPGPEEVARALAAGFAVAVYGDSPLAGVTSLAFDPRAEPARRLTSTLRERGVREALVFNAREAPDLRAYLLRSFQHASVSSELPAASRKLARKLASGATLVVLVPREGDAPAAIREAFPGALFLADETYAREVDSSPR